MMEILLFLAWIYPLFFVKEEIEWRYDCLTRYIIHATLFKASERWNAGGGRESTFTSTYSIKHNLTTFLWLLVKYNYATMIT